MAAVADELLPINPSAVLRGASDFIRQTAAPAFTSFARATGVPESDLAVLGLPTPTEQLAPWWPPAAPPTPSPLAAALIGSPQRAQQLPVTTAGLVPLMSILLTQRSGVSPLDQLLNGAGNWTSGYQWNGMPGVALMHRFSSDADQNIGSMVQGRGVAGGGLI